MLNHTRALAKGLRRSSVQTPDWDKASLSAAGTSVSFPLSLHFITRGKTCFITGAQALFEYSEVKHKQLWSTLGL